MCEPYCNMNKVFEIFKGGFDKAYKLASENKSLPANLELTYPVADVSGFSVHLDRSLFGVRLQEDGKNYTGVESKITNMEYVKVFLFMFRGDKGDKLREAQFSTWELAAYEWSLNQYNSDKIELQIVGTDILDAEMIRDGRRMTPFFAAGFAFMISFVSICVYGSAVYYKSVDRGKM